MSHLKAFILLDMIGDADLNRPTFPQTMNRSTTPLPPSPRRWVSSKDEKHAQASK